MKKLAKTLLAAVCLLSLTMPAFCQTIGAVDYKEVLMNYTKAQKAYSELDDKASELQRYLLDKEKEYKQLTTPVQKKTFEETTAKAYADKRAAIEKLQLRKEEEIDADIDKAIKAVALENKIDTVVDKSVLYFGGVDITSQVVKKLNLK